MQEAGGVIVGGKDSALTSLSSSNFGDVTPEILQGRKYLVVRNIGDSSAESKQDAQRRVIKTFYDTIDEWEAA